jgi:hypothetical protein
MVAPKLSSPKPRLQNWYHSFPNSVNLGKFNCGYLGEPISLPSINLDEFHISRSARPGEIPLGGFTSSNAA